MADKKTPEELAREKKLEEELFSKTMGFTHTPSAEELERTVILTPAEPQKPEPEDFESTVRFSNFDALVESTVSNNTDELKQEGASAQPPASELEAPSFEEPVAKPPVETAASTTPKAPAAEQPAPEIPAREEAAHKEAAITPPEIGLDFTDSDFGLSTIESSDADLATVDTLDVTLSGIAPTAAEEETPSPVEQQPEQAAIPETEDATFDSSAALDELDELLKTDVQDAESSTAAEAEELLENTDSTEDAEANAYDPSSNDEHEDDLLEMDVNAMPTIQLSAVDMADEDALLSEITDDDDTLVNENVDSSESLDEDEYTETATEAEPVQESLLDLSGMEAALDDELEHELEHDSNDTASEENDLSMPDLTEQEETSGDDARQTDDADASADTFMEDMPDTTDASAVETPESSFEAPIAAPALASSPTNEPISEHVNEPATAAAPTEKRKGSGFAIFLSLLALAGVGASYWLNQGVGIQGNIEPQLAQTADRMNQLQSENRQLTMRIDKLTQKNDALEQRLNDLARVVANRTVAEQKKSVRKSRPVIQPSTPVKSTKSTVTSPAATNSIPRAESWVINLTSVSSEESAKQEIARLHLLGIEAASIRTEARGKIWYRIRVVGFDSLQKAEAESARLAEMLGIKDIWVGRP